CARGPVGKIGYWYFDLW
nr:immunoglobulin heavy chain junction region [Macaca mulatta]MOV37898.1 immunoglobulin heavy chain junction region [Macaca mulatta]MOV38053.1 immunoglobulin heavy chain junction region [Macaca mulatta]MOV38588.1 immunoglobulin heavy chain junction region [Macaca mulatta]MOV38846.1 immunoglobulin heavy chain junction region [Macaca mulatta]